MKHTPNYYPIIIPTLCRYEHLKRCVESLAACNGAEHTELVLGLDFPPSEKYVEGYNKIKAYIPLIKGFKKVTCLERDENWGPVANMQNLKEYAFSKYDALIYTEDDNEFSPCFLQFVNGALDAYRDEKKVLSVCGYTPESFYGISKGKQLFVSDTCAWGMGIWRAKEQFVSSVPPIYYRNILRSPWKSLMLFIHYPMLLNMLMDMVLGNLSYGDVKRTAYCILNHYYQVRPLVSMVRNWGFDGSGVNCNKVKGEKMSTQQIEEGSYTFAFQRPRKTRGLKKALFFHGTEADRHVAYKQIRRTFKRYLKGWWHRSF